MKNNEKKVATLGIIAIIIIVGMGFVIQRQSSGIKTSAEIDLGTVASRIDAYAYESKVQWDKLDYDKKAERFKDLALSVSPVLRSNYRLCDHSIFYKKYAFEDLYEFFLESYEEFDVETQEHEEKLNECHDKVLKLNDVIESNEQWDSLENVKKSIPAVEKIL